jgi:hypothetical protein
LVPQPPTGFKVQGPPFFLSLIPSASTGFAAESSVSDRTIHAVRQATTLKFVRADAPVRLAIDFDLLGIAQVLNRAWTRKSKSKAADKSGYPIHH